MKLKLFISVTLGFIIPASTIAGSLFHPLHPIQKAAVSYVKYHPGLLRPTPICALQESKLLMMTMTQNEGRSLPNPCNPFWFDRIGISGGINIDVSKWGNRSTNYMGVNYQRFSINDAYINIDGRVNPWINGFMSISFSTPTVNPNPTIVNGFNAAEYDAGISNNINVSAPAGVAASGANNIQIEQAFLTIMDEQVSPLFFQAGKQFQDFSRYQIHPITLSMTQVLSEILTTSAKLGFVLRGFSGGIAIFDDPINQIGSSSKPTNYLLSFGYNRFYDCYRVGWDVGGAFLFNFIGANNIAYNVQSFTGGGYHKHVSAMAYYLNVMLGKFTLNVRYTAAIQRFNVKDLTKNGIADLTTIGPVPTGALGIPLPVATGAKPWAAVVQAGYGFCFRNYKQYVYVAYQTSRETAGLNLPKHRGVLGYNIDVWRNTNFAVEWDRENAFKSGNGGSGKNNTNLVTLRGSVKFS